MKKEYGAMESVIGQTPLVALDRVLGLMTVQTTCYTAWYFA